MIRRNPVGRKHLQRFSKAVPASQLHLKNNFFSCLCQGEKAWLRHHARSRETSLATHILSPHVRESAQPYVPSPPEGGRGRRRGETLKAITRGSCHCERPNGSVAISLITDCECVGALLVAPFLERGLFFGVETRRPSLSSCFGNRLWAKMTQASQAPYFTTVKQGIGMSGQIGGA